MNKFLSLVVRPFGYFLALFILIFSSQFIFRYLYYIDKNRGGSWIGTDLSWSLVFGEIFAYFFFSLFLIVIFCYRRSIKIVFLLIIFLINLLGVFFVFGFSDYLIISLFLIISLSGYLLAELLKYLIKKFKNK